MPIEVPDTRAFADPPPRRRRRAADVAVEPVAVDPVAPEQVAVAPDPVAAGFSRPVRRRPKITASAVVAPPVVAPSVVEAPVAPPVAVTPEPGAPAALAAPAGQVEARRGAEGLEEVAAATTDTVVVRLGGTRYAVEMAAVAEVGRPPHVTRVPGVPSWIAGVANWRGRVLPVLDLRVLLSAPSPELGVTGRILVLTRDGVTLAFLAERVDGVVSLELDRLEPVLATLSRTTASVLAGQLTHPDGPIAVLDLDTLFALRSQLPRVRRAG